MGNRISDEEAFNNLSYYLYQDSYRDNPKKIDKKTLEIIKKAIRHTGTDSVRKAETMWKMKHCGILEEDMLIYFKNYTVKKTPV